MVLPQVINMRPPEELYEAISDRGREAVAGSPPGSRRPARLLRDDGAIGSAVDGPVMIEAYTTSQFPASCVVCTQGTDTALGLQGDAEWIIVGLEELGVPRQEATRGFCVAAGTPYPMVLEGDVEYVFVVCTTCVEKANEGRHRRFPSPVLVHTGAGIPVSTQPPLEELFSWLAEDEA